MDAVSTLPELLENVLLNLPIRDILVNAQRVDKTFHATILGSTKLQQALFFKPLPIGKDLAFDTHANTPRWKQCRDDDQRYTIFANPFYRSLCKRREYEKMECLVPDHPAFTRKEASWRRMLVTQPPTTTNRAEFNIHRRFRQKHADSCPERLFEVDLRFPAVSLYKPQRFATPSLTLEG